MAIVKQTQKMIPFVTCEISLGKHVDELVFGVAVFDLDLGIQIDSIVLTNQVQLCGSWKHVSLWDSFI